MSRAASGRTKSDTCGPTLASRRVTPGLVTEFVCLTILVLSGARLGVVGARQVKLYQYSRNENSLIPGTGSFLGIDADGREREPRIDASGYLLVFVVHHRSIDSEINFWDDVEALTTQARPEVGRRIEYWGICDDGKGCDARQPTAHFTVLGYLEPFGMRIAAQADTRGEVLLYNRSGSLQGHVPRALSVRNQADLILNNCR